MASAVTPPLSIGHGIRFVTDPGVTMEAALLAVGEQIGYNSISYASRMNKAVVVFLKEERLVHELIESGVFINDLFVQVSPLSVPSTRIVISGVPPFIPNELIEKELRRFGMFASGFKTVTLGCKDARLKHVISLRRQVFMFLDTPTNSLDISFKVKYEGGYYTVFASSGSMKCFECGDVGHKRLNCPHREQVANVEHHNEQLNARSDETEGPSNESVVQDVQVHSETDEEVVKSRDDVAAEGLEQSTSAEAVVMVSNIVEYTGSKTDESDNMVSVEQNVQVVTKEKEGLFVSNSQASSHIESDLDEMEQDESDAESVEGYNKMMRDLYSLEDINHFLDETFGQSVKVDDYFADTEKFIRSVTLLQKMVSFDLLDERKRYRLRKHVTTLKKAAKLNITRKGKKALTKLK